MTFFRFLARKLERDPRPEAERRLRNRLDAEFERDYGRSPARNPFAWIAEIEIFRFAPIAVAAALVLALGIQLERVQPKSESATVLAFAIDEFEASWLDAQADRIEFYDEMEDWMLTASDEDWDALLEKDG